ncbi:MULTISPECIES: hypothetical protein [unclassified Bradyrhizobium]|uniref:hypothetical protein n=1 Tax=unclassified Bradyrhizobium TaxID=2631580 RepID=UPI00102E9958|nr:MULTISPECIES: hypothetical protein [unclassified Bradyrhizobium]MDI4232377.1 hypothetical protein [Bradyrhizobium sp. Arg237L]TAI64659.1 hypothetical protein CWO89_17735 [Bradyrhizobium sp. Leo170]
MTYTHESKKPTAAQQAAQKAFREADTKVAMSEYERNQEAFHANRERLKAERLAREAAATGNVADKKKRSAGEANRDFASRSRRSK